MLCFLRVIWGLHFLKYHKFNKCKTRRKLRNICCLVYMDSESIYVHYWVETLNTVNTPYPQFIYVCNGVPIRMLFYIHPGVVFNSSKHSGLENYISPRLASYSLRRTQDGRQRAVPAMPQESWEQCTQQCWVGTRWWNPRYTCAGATWPKEISASLPNSSIGVSSRAHGRQLVTTAAGAFKVWCPHQLVSSSPEAIHQSNCFYHKQMWQLTRCHQGARDKYNERSNSHADGGRVLLTTYNNPYNMWGLENEWNSFIT